VEGLVFVLRLEFGFEDAVGLRERVLGHGLGEIFAGIARRRRAASAGDPHDGEKGGKVSEQARSIVDSHEVDSFGSSKWNFRIGPGRGPSSGSNGKGGPWPGKRRTRSTLARSR